jgi:hypothetical protein
MVEAVGKYRCDDRMEKTRASSKIAQEREEHKGPVR